MVPPSANSRPMPRAVRLASIAASSTFRPELITSTPGKPVVDVAAGRLAGITEPLGHYYMHPHDISGPPERLPYQASLHPAGELNHARRRPVIPGTSYLAQDGTQTRWTRFDPKRSASARQPARHGKLRGGTPA